MATTLIPVELDNGLVQIIREDESYNVSYAPVLELNTIDVDDTSGDVTVFEVRSNRRTILRVDQLLLDNGAFTNYSDVQEAYDDCYDVIQSALSGLSGGGGPGASDFTDLGDTFASYTGKAGKLLRVKDDESGIEEIALVLDQNVEDVQISEFDGGTYTPGTYVNVTENIGGLGGSSGTLFKVGNDGFLEPKGYCQTYLNGAMDDATPVYITWDVTTNFVSAIEEPTQGNRVTAFYNTAGLTGFPFDTTSIFQTTLIDPVSCTIDVAAIIKYSYFEGYNTINIAAGATHRGRVGQEATVTLGGTSIYTGLIGDNGGVTLIGTQALNWCTICANENVDCSTIDAAYTQTGKYIGGGLSTFECSVLIDLNALTELNITQVNATEDYSFCGRFLNVQNSGGAVDIESIISNQTGHEILFILGHSDAISFSTGGGLQTKNGATINLTTLGSTFGVMYNDVISKFMENGNTLII